jgi:hypothetical protein
MMVTNELHAALDAAIRNNSGYRERLHQRITQGSSSSNTPESDAVLCASAVVEAIDRLGLILAATAKAQHPIGKG